MIRGFVYSFIAICVFLCGSVFWMAGGGIPETEFAMMSGWLLLICFFAVGPVFFMLGYWHHRCLFPDEPHWDREEGE